MTIAAAVLFTVVYFADNRSKAAFTTMLMFWGAALMWAVDCVTEFMAGEPLFDLSWEDAILGFIILTVGVVVYGLLALREQIALGRALSH
jgi:uncharacterized membrane protein